MRSAIWISIVLVLFNLACSSESGDGEPAPQRQPIDIVVPEDLKDKSFHTEHVVLPTNYLVPSNIQSREEALGRVVLDAESAGGMLWPKFLKTEKTCLTSAIEAWPQTGLFSTFGSLTRKIVDREDAYLAILPFDVSHFQNERNQELWIPEVARMADLIRKADGEPLYDSADFMVRAWRQTLQLDYPHQWNVECGTQPADNTADFSSTMMLGMDFHLVMKVSAAGPGTLKMENGDSPSYEVMFNSQAQLREVERFLVGQRARISIYLFQLGGDPVPLQEILGKSQCQIYALQKCRETVTLIRDEINRQQARQEESETFHWAPMGYGFLSL